MVYPIVTDVLKTLASTAIVVAMLGYFARTTIKHFLQRNLEEHKAQLTQEAAAELLAQKNKFDKQMEAFKTGLTAETTRKDRIREEITRWANPILGSVEGLEARLENVLSNDGYLALSPDAEDRINPEWSVTYDYFLPSTIYLFCQYFCWIRLFDEKLSFELFRKHQEMNSFRERIRNVERMLGSFPLKELDDVPAAGDRQVFRLQQRAMGEALASQEGSDPRCMRLSDFMEEWKDPDFRVRFDPLMHFLDQLEPKDERRWKRLELMKSALHELHQECAGLLAT